MVTQSARRVRWMGLAGFIAGVVWSGRYFVPFEPSDAVREYGHVLLSVLFVVGLIGFYAQQADRLNRTAKAGSLFLLLSLGSWLGLNVLGTLLRIGDDTLPMNILGVAFAFALPPGFLLLGLGMKGAAVGLRIGW